MGPPPDPEQMASMLENPNFASTLNEALSNPDVIEQMIRSNPMFQGAMGQQARQMLQDPNFRRMMTDPQMLRQMSEMRRNMPGMFGGMGGMGMGGGLGAGGGGGGFPMPGATDAATANAGEAQGTGAGGEAGPNTSQSPPPANPFAMFGQPGAGGPNANPFAALFGGAGGPQAVPEQGTNTTTDGSNNRDGSNESPTQQGNTPSQQQAPANPFGALTQNLMQNPQLMQQMLGAMYGSGAPPNPSNPAAAGGTATNPSNPTPDQMNPFAALQAMYGGGGGAAGAAGGPGAGAGFNPFLFAGGAPPPQQPQDDRPPEDRYAEQLRQLNEMGFYEFERNVEALRRTGGSVQGAVEYLLTH